MAECKYIVLTTPVPGREDEYNHWYDNAHVPDLLRIPGVISAQRFRIATVQRSPGPFDFDYLAIYTFDSDDAQAIMDERRHEKRAVELHLRGDRGIEDAGRPVTGRQRQRSVSIQRSSGLSGAIQTMPVTT